MLSGHDYEHETRRVGSPYTLVITKTFKHVDLAKRYWAQRKEVTAAQLAHLDKLGLRDLLGQEYARIVDIRWADASTGSPASRLPDSAKPASDQTGSLLPKVDISRGLKRKAGPEIIDLT